MPKVLSFIITFFITNFIFSQNKDYYNPDFFKFSNKVFYENIKTVQLYNKPYEDAPPVINLLSEDILVLRFDDLDADVKNYSYTIIHCNHKWEPSNLSDHEYIDGYFEEQINDYQFSTSLTQKYTHYKLEFPVNMKPKISGNYIIKVYKNYDPEDVVLTKKFYVADPKIGINLKINKSFYSADKPKAHDIDIEIDHKNYEITNPFEEIKAVVTQNNRNDNSVTISSATLVHENNLYYDLDRNQEFVAGNEYRWFDFRSFRFLNEHTNVITKEEDKFHVYLFPDKPRVNNLMKSSDKDIEGQYIIKVQEGFNNYIDADYAYIHLKLVTENRIDNGNIYVMGGFNDWNISENSKMKYNEKESYYEIILFFKQGFYNYEYVFVKNGDRKGDSSVFEGSYYDTGNVYSVYVYHRKWAGEYDELIGIKYINSGDLLK